MKEIERKFLVRKDYIDSIKNDFYYYSYIKQNYVCFDPEIRLRSILSMKNPKITNYYGIIKFDNIEKTYLTIKSDGDLIREEKENEVYGVDINLNTAKYIIEKYRYICYSRDNKKWEIDIFEKNLSGLYLAEIELKDSDEKFILPEWILKEVTYDKRYKNKNLALTQTIPVEESL